MLSKVGWERWRAWAGGASGDGGGGGSGGGGGNDVGGDDAGGGGAGGRGGGGSGDSGSSEGGSKREGDKSLVGKRSEGAKPVDNNTEAHLSQREGGNLAATDGGSSAVEAALIAKLASALDLHLSGTSLVLEPWDYEGAHCAKGAELRRGRNQDFEDASVRRGRSEDFGGARVRRIGREGFEGGGGGGGGGDGEAVVVRADLSMRMTSGLFLDGHWMVELGAGAFSST